MGSEGHSPGILAVVNGVINAVINGALGYGIAWLHTNRWSFDWYTHVPDPVLEDTFVVGDVLLGAFLVGVIVTLIVKAIFYWDWDRGGIKPTQKETFLLSQPRSRVQHALVTGVMLGIVFAITALLSMLVYFGNTGNEWMTHEAFILVKVGAGLVAGYIAGHVATMSAAVNLSHGMLEDTSDQGNLIARLSLWSSVNPKKVVGVVLAITLVSGYGLTLIETEVDVADVLPRENPNTEAMHNVSDHFSSTFTQQVTLQWTVDEERCLKDSQENLPQRHAGGPLSSSQVNCGNITDEVYVRAIDEFFEFLQEYEMEYDEDDLDDMEPWEREEELRIHQSPFEYMIGLPSFYKLINWTLDGGQERGSDDAFALPPVEDRAQWTTLHEATWAAIDDTMTPTMSPSHTTAAILFLVPADTEHESIEIGDFVLDARDHYLEEWGPENAEWTVFLDENYPRFTADFPVANSHSSTLAEEDLMFLLPLIIFFIFIALFAAFRNVQSVLLAGGAMGIGVVWTYGMMGYADIAMNPLNLTVVPLIMGVGIDYSIHMINEFLEHKNEGRSDKEAFRLAGERAGFAMAIATATTIGGLAVMVISPSLLMAQLGFLSAIAIGSIYLLTIAFIPAVLSLLPDTERMGAKFKPSRMVPTVGGFVYRFRYVFGALLIVATVAGFLAMDDLGVDEFGEPGLNYPEGDPIREEHLEGLGRFYELDPEDGTLKTNVIIIEGDLLNPQTHRYIDALSASLAEKAEEHPDIINMDTSRDLPFFMRTWNTVCCGPEQVPVALVSELLEEEGIEEASQYPDSREEIEQTYDEIFRSPLATFASLFLDYPRTNMTVITIAVQSADFQEADEAWHAIWEAIDDVEEMQPEDVQVAFGGNTPTNFLFVEEQLPWLDYMSLASFLIVTSLVALFTRDLRATVAVGLLVGASTVLLLGLLPRLGIGLAITMMLPLLFVYSIGSDFAVHLMWNMKKVKNPPHVMATVGKAVLFSAITTFGAFALFTPIPGTPLHGIRDLMVQKAMVATIVAIVILFVMAVLVTSIFYNVRDDVPHAEEDPSTTDAGDMITSAEPETGA